MQGKETGVLDRIQEALGSADLDCAILNSLPNVYYASGAETFTSRLIVDIPSFVVVPRTGESAIVVCSWDEEPTKRQSPIKDVRSYSGHSAVSAVAQVVREKGLGAARLGMEERYLRTVDYTELVALLPQARLLPCDEIMLKLRMIKTPQEIELLRHAAVCTEKAIWATFATARPGDTERDLANRITCHLFNFGAMMPFIPALTAGSNAAIPHLLPSDKPIAHGEIIHLDVGGLFSYYWSDISRNAVVGQPSPQQRSTYKRLWEIQQRIIEEMKVGTRVSDLTRLLLNLFERQGFAEPVSCLGHGIGLENHELPDACPLDLDNDAELQAGMVLAVEPSIIVPGEARYDIEDTVLITEEGPELLSAWHSTEDMFLIE